MRTIDLTRGKVAFVDDSDYKRVAQFKWYALLRQRRGWENWSAVREQSKGNFIYMHRFILDASPTIEVDHIDGDGLNNQRSNLRLATRAENARNYPKIQGTTSRYKGVVAFRGRWQAYIHTNDRKIHLGTFDVEEDAASAYDEAAIRLFGTFAKTNFDWQGMLNEAYEQNKDR